MRAVTIFILTLLIFLIAGLSQYVPPGGGGGGGGSGVSVKINGGSAVGPQPALNFIPGTGLAGFTGVVNGSQVDVTLPIDTAYLNGVVRADCVAASGSGTAYTCSTVPTFAPAAGIPIRFKADVANTASATLNVNSSSAAPLKKQGGGTNLIANDLLAGQWVDMVYDGTNWQMQGQTGNATGGGGGVTAVNEVTGAFTCNFTSAVICLVTQTDATNPWVPTITNLPTNKIIQFVFSTTSLVTVTWPATAFCATGDAWAACGSVNGYTTGNTGKYTTTWWSDGTNFFSTGDSGNIQTVNAAHVNVSQGQIYNITTLGAGNLAFILGSTISFTNCISAASPAACSNAPTGWVTVAAGATTKVVNTSAVSGNSHILLISDTSTAAGTALGVTCNTTTPATYSVSAQVASTSFTITSAAPTTNPACFSYWITN